MKNLFLFSVIALAFSSCQKADELTWTERHVVGSWFYTNVDFTERWSIKKEDITKDYFGDIITFEDDFTTTYEDNDQGLTLTGVWQVNQVSTYNASTNGTTWTDQVIASYENPSTGEITQMVWDNFWVNKNRIGANTSDKEGHYRFDLKKF